MNRAGRFDPVIFNRSYRFRGALLLVRDIYPVSERSENNDSLRSAMNISFLSLSFRQSERDRTGQEVESE